MNKIKSAIKSIVVRYETMIISCAFVFAVIAANSACSTPVNITDGEYDFIPSNGFIDKEVSADTINKIDTSDPSAIELIWGCLLYTSLVTS